jgi:hypothetical protein
VAQHPIDASTLQILTPGGQIVGTGFLVSRNLIATCAHVVTQAGAKAGEQVYVCFTNKVTSITATVLPEYWRPDNLTDVAILRLAAPAGRGKSALLVRWLDVLQARGDLELAFVPVSIRFGTNMERVFYASLAARLAWLHGDSVPSNSETSTEVYRGLVNDYLSKSLANDKTLIDMYPVGM